MKTPTIASAAGLAAGAAIAFAPLAAAAPTDLIDFDTVNSSQIASLNALFQFGAVLTGVPDSAYSGVPGGLLFIDPEDLATYAPPDPATASDVTPFEYYLYGVNPIEAGISSGSSSANVFNGAAIQFADSYNATLYGLFNPNEVAPTDIFIGSEANVTAALASDNPAVWFYDRGIGDLSGYFQTNLSFLQIPLEDPSAAAADDIDFSGVLSSQIATLNSVFDTGAALTGVPADAIDVNEAGFSTVPLEYAPVTLDPTELTPFSYFLYGADPIDAGIASDPGSYVVFNGALTQFFDAYNVGLYALLSGGDLVPADSYGDFLFGAEDSILDAIGGGATVSSAITDFLTNGFADLAGYFDVGSLFAAM